VLLEEIAQSTLGYFEDVSVQGVTN
jgi:hypothetical protein